jgi:guanosine-3',5'-bis(diphosphate) 3'-pyrophosphohydrolase
MLYKIFYSLLMGVSPWMASSSLSTVLSFSPEAMEQKAVEASNYSQKEQKIKEILAQLVRSDQDVLAEFDAFSSSLKQGIIKGLISEKDAEIVLNAVAFSAEKHKLQVKSNAEKTPYIIHPIEVADHVARIGGVYDRDVLVAALLHDVLEGTTATEKEIGKLYGNNVASYVLEMTTTQGISLKEQKKEQIRAAFHQTPSVAIIKLSDKLSNLETLAKNPPSNWSRDRIDQYFQWAQSVIENLPEANLPLKKQVKHVISDYWSKESVSKKS